MNAKSAHTGRSRKTSGRRLREPSTQRGLQAARELVVRLEVLERLRVILDEIGVLNADVDVDVPRTLAEGLLEDVEAALAEEPEL